jgi:hypothetical protein
MPGLARPTVPPGAAGRAETNGDDVSNVLDGQQTALGNFLRRTYDDVGIAIEADDSVIALAVLERIRSQLDTFHAAAAELVISEYRQRLGPRAKPSDSQRRP